MRDRPASSSNADVPPRVPDIVSDGWLATRDPRRLSSGEEIRIGVSTNRVFRLSFEGGSHAIAKVASFGSFVHFRQDHERICQWIERLGPTRWKNFLAPVVSRNGQPCLHRDGPSWVVFYEEVEAGEQLPRVLSDTDVENLAEEIARFHKACLRPAARVDPTWKTLGSDIATLRDQLDRRAWCETRGIGPAGAVFLREHCDAFLVNADAIGVHRMRNIPVLVDWNLGNFGVRRGRAGFRLYRRWDYDWFRVGPRVLDFYFLSRVASATGDRTRFSYGHGPFFEERFGRFLRAYHACLPLRDEDILMLGEVYRFFLLNYVIRDGDNFFLSELCERLRREAIHVHLPAFGEADFGGLRDRLR
jgi:Ser/Thr protein kinase RdoA (MazF antagonist)